MTTKDDISELTRSDIVNMVFMPVPEQDEWKIGMLKELIDVQWDEVVIEGFVKEVIGNIMEEICTS